MVGVHTSQSCFLEQGDRCIREPSHLFESIVIVGLPPHADIQELENIALGRNDEDGKRSRNLFSNSHQVHAISNLEPQVSIHLTYCFMLSDLISNTLWQGPAYHCLSKNKSLCWFYLFSHRFFLHTLQRSLFHSSTRIPSLSAFPEVYRSALTLVLICDKEFNQYSGLPFLFLEHMVSYHLVLFAFIHHYALGCTPTPSIQASCRFPKKGA